MTLVLSGPLIRFDTEGALRHETHGALAIDGGLIADAGAEETVRARHPGAEVRPAGGLIAPGFVDAHVHYPQIGVIASWGADLIDWLNTYTFPEEMRFADAAYAAARARDYFDTQLRHGVTTAASFCTVHPASVDAYFTEAARRGLCAVGGKVMMDRNAPPGLCDTAQSGHDESAALIARWHGQGRAVYAISPRFAPTSTPDQLEAAGALWADHPDCLMQTHLSEQPAEIAWVAGLFPEAPDYLGVYERFGLCGPGAVFGHAIHLTARERAVLAGHDAAIAHCPTSNQFLGSGACDLDGLAATVRTGLATDTGGGTSFSMFHTMKSAYELAMSRGVRLAPARLWWLATVGAARALRLEHRIGTLMPGSEADFIVLDTASTPLIAQRVARAERIEDVLFAQIILADDRAIRETWSGGRRVWPV